MTGSQGFVGSAVVRALSQKHPEYWLIGLDSQDPKEKPEDHSVHTYFQADVRRYEEVARAFAEAKAEVIIHTAGVVPQLPVRYTGQGRAAVHEVNVKGTANVLAAAQEINVKALVYTSTCCVVTDDQTRSYPNFDESAQIPKTSSTYGETKAEAEGLVLGANSKTFSTCALRPSVILGENDYQLIPAIHACIAKGETPYVIGNGDNLYDFVYVGNIADAHVLAVEKLMSTKTAAGEAILISNGEPVTFRDFCLAVWGAFDHVPPYTVYIPAGVARFGGLLSECYTRLTGSPATLSRGSVGDAIGTRYANIAKARELLGYEPQVDLADAVRLSVEVRLRSGHPSMADHFEGLQEATRAGAASHKSEKQCQ